MRASRAFMSLLCFTILLPAAIAQTEPPADAHYFASGAQLLEACRESLAGRTENTPLDRCRRFLTGYIRSIVHLRRNDCVSDVQHFAWQAELECLRNVPDELSFEQIAQIVIAHGDAHPELLEGPPSALVKEALKAAFPGD